MTGRGSAIGVLLAASLSLLAVAPRAQAQASGPLLRRHAQLSRALRRPASPRRERRLVRLLDDAIDYEMIVRRVLVVHWDGMSSGQREDALQLLSAAIRHRYRSSIEALGGWTVRVESERARGVGRRVETVAVRGNETRRIGYDLFAREGQWRVVDLVVDGESLVHDYRNQFDRVVRREGVDGLLRRLRDRVEEDAS